MLCFCLFADGYPAGGRSLVQERRECFYMMVPPVGCPLGDYKSHLLVALPTEPVEVHYVAISLGRARVSRIRPDGPGGPSAVTVISLREERNDVSGNPRFKHVLTLRIEGP